MVDETGEDHDVEVKIDNSSVRTVSLISKRRTSSAVYNYYGVKSDSSGNPFVANWKRECVSYVKRQSQPRILILPICFSTLRVATQKHMQKSIKQLM